MSLERKMKISQNFGHTKLNKKKGENTTVNLWEKEVQEINKILKNFENLSLM